jgi:protein TonB
MHLFKSRDGAFPNGESALFGGADAIFMRLSRGLYAALTAEERLASMLGLSMLLALTLHLGALVSLPRPAEPSAAAQPLLMEVSLLAAPQPQAAVSPVPSPPVKKPSPPKTVKPKAVKQPPVAQKMPELPRTDTVAETKPASEAASKAAAPPAAVASPAKGAEKFTEANYRANYASNPKPDYPRIARSRGWEGKVLLRVQVSAEGNSGAVAVQTGSGHDLLDEAAVAAVEKWKFIPARRGETPVASSVIVPIIFRLD